MHHAKLLPHVLVIVLAAGLAGCASTRLPSPWVYKGPSAGGTISEGRDFCVALEKSARDTALAMSTEALVLANFTGAMVVGSAVMSAIGAPDASKDPGANKAFRGINIGLTASAGALAATTIYMFNRASTASDTAARAASSASEADDDKAAHRACNEALAQWNSARATSLTNTKPKGEENTGARGAAPTIGPRQ